MMEEIEELKKVHNLEESSEYIIIPYRSADGREKRCFLLKRRFIRISYKDGRSFDCTLAEAIEALLKYPDMKLSEALLLTHGDDIADGRLATQDIYEDPAEPEGPAPRDDGQVSGQVLQA
jgi:hypothetical protein